MEFVDLIQVAFSFAKQNGFTHEELSTSLIEKSVDKGTFGRLALNNLNPNNPSNKLYFENKEISFAENSLLNGVDLFYPSAIEWMWSYCIYLGAFTASDGTNYDLGIHIGKLGEKRIVSAAIVYGNEAGNYISGQLDVFGSGSGISKEYYEETKKRAKALGLYN